MAESLWIGNDMELRLHGFKDSDDVYVNDATVTATVKDSDGVDVPGAVGIVLSYVSGSNGNYEGVLPDTVALVAGSKYMIHYTGTRGGLTYHAEVPAIAKVRRK